MIDDATLLRRYARDRSEEAFAEFVHRHLPLVYSAALRRLGGDAHRAEDVAQVVFCAVARDAHRLSKHAVLTGWLYTATRNAVIDVVRAENRRRGREEEAHIMQETSSDLENAADWSRLRPVLDAAMDELSGRDREAVLLRFFQGRPFAEIGVALGLSEDAARKRVDRALDQLGGVLRRHRIVSTSAALATVLAGETISAAPASLAASITGAALAAGGGATAGIATFFAMTKLQLGLAAVVVAGLGVGLFTQQRTIAELRGDAAGTSETLAKLAAENAALKKARRDADAEMATLRREIAAREKAAATEPARPAAMSLAVAPRNEPRVAAATPDPALARKLADLHRRYDPFLQQYGLTSAQMDRFVELKQAIYEAQDDLQAAVRQAGAQGGTTDVEAMRSKLVGPLWNEIRELLGREGYSAYGDYERSSFYLGAFVEPMNAKFAQGGAPLSDAQVKEMIAIVAANDRPQRVNHSDISTHSRIDWDTIVSQSKTVLTSAQQTVLESYAERAKTRGSSR